MNPQSLTTLNPHAPLYIPLPPGITTLPPPPPPPYHVPPPPSYYLHPSPPFAAAFHQQPSQIFDYPVRLYTQPFSSSPYNIQAQNPNVTTYVPLLPSLPPPTATAGQSDEFSRPASTHKRYFEPTRTGRGGGPSGRGFQRGGSWRRSGRGRENSSNNFERRKQQIGKGNFQEGSSNLKNSGTNFRRNQKFEKRDVQKEENRHKLLPLKRDEEKTTVMIKNIPYEYTRKMLLRRLDEFCMLENEKVAQNGTTCEEYSETAIVAAYDFLYYPIDFKSKKGRGFAFVNFTHPRTIWNYFDAFHHKKWDSVEWARWPKMIEIVCAKIQGKEALKKHFEESTFECESDEFLPVSFSPPRDGSIDPSVKLTTIGKRRATPYWETKNNHQL
ncbi:protein terminal ear1-like protein [Forsythia ovata]|uniref:Protein terminal ear1-like protein n=1 Tax=Forsythia ovata TaxID=205694 RepID=A0ABD1VJR8_9LAMI